MAINVLCLLFNNPAPGQSREFTGLGNIKDTTYINYLIQRADSFYPDNNKKKLPDSATALLKEALKLSLSISYSRGVRKAASSLSSIYYYQYNDSQVIHYANIQIHWCNDIKNRKELFEAYCMRGSAYLQGFQDFNKALDSYLKSLSYAANSEDSARIYNNISALMLSANQYNKGLDYANKGLALTGIGNNRKSLFMNKALLYAALNDSIRPVALYDSALRYAASISEKVEIHVNKIFFFDETGHNAAMLNEFAFIKPVLDSGRLSSQMRAKALMAGGITYLNAGNYKRSESYLLEAEKLSQFLGQDKRVLDHLLSTLYYKTKNYKKAYDLHVLVHRTDDSIRSAQVQFTINELETKYRSVHKDQVIARQEVQLSKSKKQLYLTILWGGGSIALLLITSLLLGIRYYYLKQKSQQRESEQTVNRLKALIEGEEKERTRMSHELHDGVNSTLAATTSYLQMVAYKHPEIKTEASFLKVKELLSSSSSEIRSIAHNLAPHILTQHGLFYAIEAFCHNLFPETIHVDILCSGNEEKLPQLVRLFIYRTVQELLHNVHKHAQATELGIYAETHTDHFSLSITDNGKGLNDREKNNGIGLQHIQEKVKAYHGKMEIGTNKQTGTKVYLSIPLE